MQYDRSLLTLDIDGAQPRPMNAYMNRLLPNQLSFQEQIQLQRQIPHQDFQFGRRRYQHDFHHLCNLCVPQGEEYTQQLIELYYTLIKAIKSITKNKKGKQINLRSQRIIMIFRRQLEFDRLLYTKDIDGAISGSLQSQAVRNQELAKKLRLEREKQQRIYNNSMLDNNRREERYQNTGRQRSHTIQIDSHLIVNRKKQSTEVIEKLPPISYTIDHTANKLQLRQHRKSFQLEDLKLLQKQALQRLYV